MKTTFRVKLTIPDGVSKDQMAGYIEDAVSAWKGGMDPKDPIFELDSSSVEVHFHGEQQ